MADDRYAKTKHDGKVVDKYTAYNLVLAEKRLGYPLTVVQGSYNKGGVSASSGTHDGGGAVDLAPFDWKRKVRVLRELGFAAWHRPAIRGLWGEHIHAILIGNTKASRGAKSQVASYKAHRNGLANNAVDNSWHPSPIKDAAYSTAKPTPPKPKPVRAPVRALTYNLPGADKLPQPVERVTAAAELIKDAKPSFVGLNEVVGRKGAGVPSDFAHSLDVAVGGGWSLVVPSTDLNENYLLLDDKKTALVHRYGDSIIRVKVGKRGIPGRHVTRMVLQDRATGLVYAVGVTHLVNNDPEGAHAQSVQVAETMRAVSAKHDDCPIIIVGDMNLGDDPRGFATFTNARTAPNSSTRDYDTYVTYKGTKPTKAGRRYDQIWVSGGAPKGYNVTLDVAANGKFHKPRPSDHLPTLAAIVLTK